MCIEEGREREKKRKRESSERPLDHIVLQGIPLCPCCEYCARVVSIDNNFYAYILWLLLVPVPSNAVCSAPADARCMYYVHILQLICTCVYFTVPLPM